MSPQGGAERVRPRGWTAGFEPIGHFHRHLIRTANTFRRSLNFLILHPHPAEIPNLTGRISGHVPDCRFMPPFHIEPSITSPPSQGPRGWVFTHPEVRISVLYVILGSIWIIGSDALLSQALQGDSGSVFLNAFKGLNFVLTTGILLYLVLRRSFGGWRKSEELRVSQVLAARSRFQKLSHKIEKLREEERTRISREIHDELGQLLTGLKMRIRLIENRLTVSEDRAMNPNIDDLVETSSMIDESIAAVRRISSGLRPASLDHLGLAAAIHEETAQFTKLSGIPCELKISAMDQPIPTGIETTAFRILQESLTNVARHAGAHRVVVECWIQNHVFTLSVSDDGAGFAQSLLDDSDSLGLLGMHERAEECGGSLAVESEKGRGTQVTLQIAIPQGPESEPPIFP
jgi:signal transduction histidine kinase